MAITYDYLAEEEKENGEKAIKKIRSFFKRMSQGTTTNSDLIVPSFHFNPTTFGQNIRLENDGSKAVRHTSFDHGISLIYPAI